MSATDLKFTHVLLEKPKEEKPRNPDDVVFDLEGLELDLIDMISQIKDFDIEERFEDYHQVPLSYVGSSDL